MKINEEIEKSRKLLLLVVGLLFTLAFYRTAWVAEDAFITFRVVNNALDGLGLVWNPGERVQVYTHPLWFFIILPLVGVFRDPYYVSIGLSYALLALTLYASYRVLDGRRWWAIVAFCALLWSKAFIDYSSSGLENPLLHLLTALFLWMWNERRDVGLASLLMSLLFLTRPDAVIIFLPAFFLLFTKDRRWGKATLCALPAILWVAFSLFYYGSPVPNTALAKVGTGLTLGDKFSQALHYFQWMYDNDPATLLIIFLGAIAGLTNKRLMAFSCGLMFFGIYLLYVGADYMGGRFLSAPALLAALLIACVAGKILASLLAVGLAIVYTSLMQTIFAPPNFSAMAIKNGIADERGFYYQWLGLSPVLRNGGWKAHPWFHAGEVPPGLYTKCVIGMTGFSSGAGVKWIDPLALAEPFLARLPAKSNSRIGHYERALPEGYLESMLSGENRIIDTALAALYVDTELAVRAPLFSMGRLKAVWRLNTGFHRNAFESFDRDGVGLPGVPVSKQSEFSCYGVPYGGRYTWKITGSPATAVLVNHQ